MGRIESAPGGEWRTRCVERSGSSLGAVARPPALAPAWQERLEMEARRQALLGPPVRAEPRKPGPPALAPLGAGPSARRAAASQRAGPALLWLRPRASPRAGPRVERELPGQAAQQPPASQVVVRLAGPALPGSKEPLELSPSAGGPESPARWAPAPAEPAPMADAPESCALESESTARAAPHPSSSRPPEAAARAAADELGLPVDAPQAASRPRQEPVPEPPPEQQAPSVSPPACSLVPPSAAWRPWGQPLQSAPAPPLAPLPSARVASALPARRPGAPSLPRRHPRRSNWSAFCLRPSRSLSERREWRPASLPVRGPVR